MFCIEGDMTAVYGADDGVPLPAGDVFLCEPTIRHSTNKPVEPSEQVAGDSPSVEPTASGDV